MKNCMGYMLGLKSGQAYSRDFRLHVKKSSFFFRYSNRFDQINPIFPGWLTMLAAKASFYANRTISRTFETYLPPVPSKVTDPDTIYEYMLYLQSITAKANMTYTKITLDVRAAINAFKSSGHIQKHSPGDFYFLKENFKVNFELGLLC